MDKDSLIALILATIIVAAAIAFIGVITNDKPKMNINYNDSHKVEK
jgi:hypothetical protein